jgi:hypothetical protein
VISSGGKTPELSVILTVVEGGDAVARFLDAMLAQDQAPSLEILVPYDASIGEIGGLRPKYPTVRFVDMGAVGTDRPVASAAGQHELYDRRRSAGLALASGALLAILEDRAPPRRTWARDMGRLHAELPHAVIGGAIESASTDSLNWAFYACDFSRYALPFESGPRDWVSDVNVCYKRRALEQTRDLWRDRFSEPRVHWALQESGDTLYLSSDVVVDHQTRYPSLLRVLPERFHWGRLFGYQRARHVGAAQRIKYTLLGPLLPPLLLLRHGRTHRQKGNFGRFLRAAPIMLLLLAAWTAGEVWGTITRKP